MHVILFDEIICISATNVYMSLHQNVRKKYGAHAEFGIFYRIHWVNVYVNANKQENSFNLGCSLILISFFYLNET